ncbi:YcaO-like family protein [Marinomonas algicola]|uniref:YcaO-like family protein n=1 Tax=Marinomonas algicola TaxID=2773454 RepID=UPI00174A2EB6|nr:YcaO-like family protein [Marinomonas algicola]
MKSYRTGTHRTVSPQETLDRILPHLSAMGITRLANVTGLDDIGIPVITACRPNAKAVAVSQGKGISLEAAKASAAMEAIETYHAEHIDLPVRLINYVELSQTHSVTELEPLPTMDVIPFDPHARRLWIEASRVLQSNEKQYVPYDLVHCDFTLPLPQGSGCFQLSTNGLASGNTREEATSHALCEVIERDAMALWSLTPKKRQDRQKVDLSSIKDTTILSLIQTIRNADVMLGVWNITSDLNIPTFVATIINKNESQHRPLYAMSGSGTHLDKHVAIMRAITEAVQTRLTLISGSRDDASLKQYQSRQNLTYQKNIRTELMDTPSYIDFNNICSWEQDSIEEDLAVLIDALDSKGLPCPLMIDLTKPEFNIPVVRVIAPGLEGIHDVPGYVFGKRARDFAEKIKQQTPTDTSNTTEQANKQQEANL